MTNPNKDGVPEGAIEAAWAAYRERLPQVLREEPMPIAMHDTLAAALAAALPFLVQPQAGIGVKALVWGTLRTTEDGHEAQDALCSIGHYIAASDGWFLVGQSGFNSAPNLVEAKIAADEDFEARINSALSQPLPSPQGEAGKGPQVDDAYYRREEALAKMDRWFEPLQTKEPGNGK